MPQNIMQRPEQLSPQHALPTRCSHGKRCNQSGSWEQHNLGRYPLEIITASLGQVRHERKSGGAIPVNEKVVSEAHDKIHEIISNRLQTSISKDCPPTSKHRNHSTTAGKTDRSQKTAKAVGTVGSAKTRGSNRRTEARRAEFPKPGRSPNSTGAHFRTSPETTGTGKVTANGEEVQEEMHLHLDKEETINCLVESVRNSALHKRGNYFIFNFDSSTAKETKFYKDLNATKGGSIVGEFDEEHVRNMSQKFNTSLECVVPNNPPYRGQYCCALRVTVPSGLYVAAEIPAHTGSNLILYGTDGKWKIHEGTKKNTRAFVSSSNVLNILQVVHLHKPYTAHRFSLRFKALRKPGLQVMPTAINRGVVCTPFHQCETITLTYPPLFSWATVTAPHDHVIMVSSPACEVMMHCFTLYAGDRGNQTLAKSCYSDRDQPRTAIYHTSLLHVHLDTSRYFSQAGFQLRFSFHNESNVPPKLAGHFWNCSVPSLSDFLYHLACNLEVECHDAADETDCPYSSDFCGPGYLTLGGGCFIFRNQGERSAWSEAYDVCSQRGQRLASLNTKDKWDEAVRVLRVSRYRDSKVFVGITNAPLTLPMWYRTTYQWVSSATGFYLRTNHVFQFEKCINKRSCGYMELMDFGEAHRDELKLDFSCQQKLSPNILCEKYVKPVQSTQSVIFINDTARWPRDNTYVKCPLGHYAHQFLACDVKSSCWFGHHSLYCQSSKTAMAPTYVCTNQIERVPYTLVCDHRPDCSDESDEDFCDVPACRKNQFSCDNGECIPSTKLCDGWADCQSDGDEHRCSFTHRNVHKDIPPPALVNVSSKGRLLTLPLDVNRSTKQGEICPHTHFQCGFEGNCLPLFLRCNGVYDCPGHEDEASCDTCPGFYRCHDSTVCLSYDDLCDGHAHCPQHDDEMLCDFVCPSFCVCSGLAFFCTNTFPAWKFPFLRFLDASGTDVYPADLTKNRLLIYLSLAECGLQSLDELNLPNLLSLDVQNNHLSNMNQLHLDGTPQLRELSVAGNPLTLAFDGRRIYKQMHRLDMSRLVLHVLNTTVLSAFPSLRVLNLSHSGVQRVLGEGFSVVKHLRVIDLRGCPMTWFPRMIFRSLNSLQSVRADSFKLCCSALLPRDFDLRDCFAPFDEISSCDNMLRGKEYSICVFALALLAVSGNTVSFVFRSYVSKRENKLGYGSFVTHLSVSDFLMGVYLAIIGVADRVYHGTYLWNDVYWRHSAACKLAGFLSLLSSEVSALLMCLITTDRFLVLRFPFSRVHFSSRSAHCSSLIVWVIGVLLVSVPLLPVTSHWEFYSQTGICIPLPITRTEFAGHIYSFSVLIIFNFVLFIFVSMGQLSIYVSVRANSVSASTSTKKSKDLTIARRLITVAMSDFLCWFPIGVLGVLAFKGFPIPGEVNVAVAVFVLPLNAAINPCLYTLNVILERRRHARDEKLRKVLLEQLKTLS